MRLISCLAALALALPSVMAHAQGRAAAVGVQTVEERMLAETVPVFAEVITARDGSVASRVAGTVETVNVLAGARVETGDVLVELDRELLEIIVAQSEAQMTEAEAGIATARVRLDRASTTFARIEALRGSSSFSQGRFDDAQSDVLEAQSQLTEAQAREKSTEAQLAEARYQLERSTIIAPFPGIVIEVNTIPGAFIAAGTPVVRLLDIDAFEVQASVPARYLGALQPGQELQATTENAQDLTLELRAILPLEDVSTRTRAVRMSAPGLGALSNVAVGQSITVQIPVGEARSILSVPKDALVQAQGGWTVFVADEGKAQPRSVQIGLPMGDRYEVVNGLTEGDIVVVRGNERLRPGQDIAPNPIESN
ncbi:efflux RND transporter periplasmic adaptor subunit [Cognatishimia sp. MH4019]|uniref:efflux RND transporter periplasmic adaptor subunit n=1 Tax=Cognatishimia sp. MH4019 TaxID=2854030 RepID=UPI001CD2C636|nr:efflux RND transporter periplasmic adaptor subunit [Cognatishimia sp. MH4019]